MSADELRRKLAQRLAESRGLAHAKNSNPQACDTAARTIPVAPNIEYCLLSNAQERMWFLHTLDPAASAYNVCVLWHLHGELNSLALQQSAERVTQRHSIFRTTYHTDEQGNARQRILSQLAPEWHEENLKYLPAAERTQQLATLAQQTSTASFNLGAQSPLRLVLVALDDLHHVLIMVGQHIVWDGASFGIFSRELAKGYNLFRQGKFDQDLSAPLQYVDFSHWHRQQWDKNSAQRETELRFWSEQLSPLPEPINFPKDFDTSVGEDETGEWCTQALGTHSTSALLALAARTQLTTFEVLIAVIALLMTRLSRATEVTIGTIASHRNLPELNQAIGNFGNVVPLRFSISPEWNFHQLLQHSAARCRAAFAHADIPFEHLLNHLNITRGATRNPLLDTMVTFLSHGMDAPNMDGLAVHWEKHFNGTTQADLSFDALLQDGCLQLQATWRSSLYRSTTVPNHLRRLKQLMSACIATPETPLSAHKLLLPEEQYQLTQSWGSRAAIPADANTLVACFENTVRKFPQAIAISTRYNSSEKIIPTPLGITFTNLNARANVLARWLIVQGVGPEDRIALALPRRAEWFVAMLATLKAGAAFVPIDPSYPAEYINRVIALAQPRLTFVDDGAHASIANTGDAADIAVQLASAEQAAQQLGLASCDLTDAERRQPLQSAHPVCIVFTSGSSGAPKGVVVPHSAFVNLLSSHREDLYKEAYKRTGERRLRIGHAWSLAFDASWQPALWMLDGHELHLFDVDVMQDPIALSREIIVRCLDFIELTPGMLDEVLPWLQSGLTDAGGQHLAPHVPAILAFGGEAVKQALWGRILKLDNTSGFNLYGPTEACVDSMIAKVNLGDSPSIGGPIAGAQVYVLDACMQLAPPGVAGELAIAGAGLARGYLQRGDLTAKQFIANPHGAPGSRLYRTGDRVRWLPSGLLEYIGRIDEQVKIRGFRVEPLEVEATVEKMVQRPCAVVARKGDSGALQLLCFVEREASAFAANDTIEVERLLALFARMLPAHLLPKFVIPIARLPRLPNGKIDRRALVMPEGLETAAGRPARTSLEHQLCRLIASVLGREQISIDEGFFEAGGDSISVIKLVSLARRDGINLTARQVFDSRCVARLAALLESTTAIGKFDTNNPEHDMTDSGQAQPTPLMARYLSLGLPLQRFAQIVSFKVPASLSDTTLETLLNALLQRHALLRAHLVTPAEGAPFLDIPPVEQCAKIPLYSFSHDLNAPAMARQLTSCLDPAQGIMLAAARLQTECESDCTLWLAINHLVIDASSWHIVVSDLALGYAALERNEAIDLPPVATAWRNWSATAQPTVMGSIAAKAHGTLATAVRRSWRLPLHEGQCPAASASRRLGFPLASLLPALAAVAVIESGLVPAHYQRNVSLAVERHGREPNTPTQDLSRTIGWFAKEDAVHLQAPEQPLRSADTLIALLRQWCNAVAQGAKTDAEPQAKLQADVWQLGVNFLGDFSASVAAEHWAPQPRMELLEGACGEHWPLLHQLDISAHFTVHEGVRQLQFDALGAVDSLDSAALAQLFFTLQQLFNLLTGAEAVAVQDNARYSLSSQFEHKEVTPLQYEMLRQCSENSDPWTTQMELLVANTTELHFTATSLHTSAAQLLSRHEALRAGFLPEAAATFIPHELAPDWQSLDWRNLPAPQQAQKLAELRTHWHQHRFQLDHPPLLRFMAVRLSEQQWHLLVNSHHLLLDGWSVPRVLSEWLGGACGLNHSPSSALRWGNYLDWLQTQDRASAGRYWNKALNGLVRASLLCPNRSQRSPSQELQEALSESESKALTTAVQQAGVSSAALYQLAWAHTLAAELDLNDVVFGLFDSGRAAPLDGMAALVGLVTQLVPLRINTCSAHSLTTQLRELQTEQFEWQSLPPVRVDNLDAAHRLGEFFDSLLVIENALDADLPSVDTQAPASNQTAVATRNPLSLLQEQHWRDSIGQAVGLFVYPGNPITLRLCYDPQAVDVARAQHLLMTLKQQLQELVLRLADDTCINTSIHTLESSYSNGD